jgi:membrane protein implicated in regulation of membrane protease activity
MVFDPSAEAVVEEVIQPNHRGRVRYKGSYWPARYQQSITLEEGTTCSVVNIQGITLIVIPTSY